MKKIFVLCVLLAFVLSGHSQELSPEQLASLKARHIGPIGNRVNSVSGVPGDPLTYIVGAASGGVWKTTDGGLSWRPVFDKQQVHSIGSIAIAPSNPQVVYVGTGESFIRSNVSIGKGMFKSSDGGETWSHIGLPETGRISRVLVHPNDEHTVFVAALGHGYAPQKSRGVYKTTDGGKTWEQVLFVDEHTGASDIVMDPDNPQILFAGTWQLDMKTWKRVSGGPGSGVHMSRDGGETWTKLQGNGLPKGPLGKIALAMTPAKPDRVYALIETGDGNPYEGEGEPTESGELWRSDDNGRTFRLVNSNRDLGGRQAYYTRVAASPDNPHEVYFISNSFHTSIDGGESLKAPESPFSSPNWDHHEMWIDPTDGDRMAVVGDGGVSISQNRGLNWHRIFLPVAQLYHVTTDTEVPYNVLTNRQDGPSMKGPSNSRVGGFFGAGLIQSGMWHDVGGGESGFATPDPEDPNIIWSSASGLGPIGGIVTRYNQETKQFRQVDVWPEFTNGAPASDVKYRFQWTFPLLISPHDHNTVYVTSQFVHRTTNGGQTWEVISPDLTLDEEDKQGFSGGLTGDNINVEFANVIYAFEESPVQKGLFWAGTNDGLVQISRDGGDSWTNVTENIPELPEYGVVRNIDASDREAGKAYLTIEFHQVGNFSPYVYKTEDYGQSWTKITDGIPDDSLNYTRCVREDPVREGLLYLGTERALYVSFDDGDSWQPLMTNLPPAPYYWIDIPEHFNDLVLGTYGRGIWILDDITALQQMDDQIVEKATHLFEPREAWRFHPISSTMQSFPEASSGTSPTYGASIHYWMKEVDEESTVKIAVTNAAGDTVRVLPQKPSPGLNRIHWDLEGEPTEKVVMRTKPLYADWFPMGDDRTREVVAMPSGQMTILQPPGTYQIHLMVDEEVQSQPLTVKKDPYSEGTEADIAAQQTFLQEIYADLNRTASAINEMEMLRRQLLDRKQLMKASGAEKSALDKVEAMDQDLLELEMELLQLQHTGKGQDFVRFPNKIFSKLSYLGENAAIGDFPPADSFRDVHAMLQDHLNRVLSDFESWKNGPMTDSGIGDMIINK